MLRAVILYFLMFATFPTTADGRSVANIGKESISSKEFEKSYQEALKKLGFANRPPSKAEHLEDLIRFKIGLQEAKKKKLHKHPLVKQALDLALFKGLVEVNLSKKIDNIKVSQNDLKKYYKVHPNIRSAHILVRYPVEATPQQVAEARNRANKIYGLIVKKKRAWSTDTRAYSDDKLNKDIGGEMGFHGPQSIHPLYYQTLKGLKQGEISRPIQGVYGFHIIKKFETQPFSQANPNLLRIAVFDEKRNQIIDNYFKKLKLKYAVSKNPN